jgi:hypothetical protein
MLNWLFLICGGAEAEGHQVSIDNKKGRHHTPHTEKIQIRIGHGSQRPKLLEVRPSESNMSSHSFRLELDDISIPTMVNRCVKEWLSADANRRIVVFVENGWMGEATAKCISQEIPGFKLYSKDLGTAWRVRKMDRPLPEVTIIPIGPGLGPSRGVHGDIYFLATKKASKTTFLNVVMPHMCNTESKLMYLNMETLQAIKFTEETSVEDLGIELL